MRPIPKVKPEQIARAVVDSVRTRKAETAVPGYVGALAGAAAITPEPAMRLLRKLVRDDRALQPPRSAGSTASGSARPARRVGHHDPVTRMFVAALLPDAVADDLDAFLDVRREAGALRWTSREQWHLTLAFLPDVADAQVELLLDALAGVAGRRRSLSARVEGGGAFPGVHAARVLWAGVSTDDEEELSRLAAGCRTAAATHGVATPREKFRPHLTLARSPHPFEATRWIRVLEGYRSPEWLVDRIALVASYLGEGPGGRPRYQVLAELELG